MLQVSLLWLSILCMNIHHREPPIRCERRRVPSKIVCTTRPRRGMPTYGVLRLLLANVGRHDLPHQVGVEDREVGRLTWGDRATVSIGDTGDRCRLPRQRRDHVGELHVERRERHAERGLEPEHAGRSLVERLLLGLGGVRCMVGRDRVDRAIGQPGADRCEVVRGAQWRVDLVERVVGRRGARR